MKSILVLYSSLVFFWCFTLLMSCEEDKNLWAKLESPNQEFQIILYQKDRIMHQAPEILVYFQKKHSSTPKPIGNILLPEDNRNKLTYHCQWLNTTQALLSLTCDKCMIDERTYKIALHHTPCLQEITDDHQFLTNK